MVAVSLDGSLSYGSAGERLHARPGGTLGGFDAPPDGPMSRFTPRRTAH